MIKASLIDLMGSDLSVVNAARVSFGKGSEWDIDEEGAIFLKPKDARLIKYLAKHNHISPFGHAFASFHVKAPVFVARQLVKHKFLRWNEISRRYVSDEPEFHVPDVWRGKSEDKKQGSSGVVDLDSIDQDGRPYEGHFGEGTLGDYVCDNQKDSVRLYNAMIKQGVAPEQARMILPQSIFTEWYWSGSLDAFADMCRLRLKEDTQYETRLVAQQISVIMEGLFPVSWEALLENTHD
jgi:thymidylate synthase (FAD)